MEQKHAHLADTVQAKVALEPEEGKVSVTSLEEVGGHQHPHVHVDRNKLATRGRQTQSDLEKQRKTKKNPNKTDKAGRQCVLMYYGSVAIFPPVAT